MSTVLTPCASCRRHVRSDGGACPFCGETNAARSDASSYPRASRAHLLALAAAAVIAGCDKRSEAPAPTNVATESKSVPSAASAPSASVSAPALAVEPSPIASASETPSASVTVVRVADAGAPPKVIASSGGGKLMPLDGINMGTVYGGPPAPADGITAPVSTTTLGASAGSIADADSTLAKNRWRFKACYNKALAADPGEQGEVRLQVTTDNDGAVTKAVVVSSIVSATLTQCVLSAAHAIKFGGPGTSKFPVQFRKGK